MTRDESSAAVAEQIGSLESIDPPRVLAEWHGAVLAYLTALEEALDGALESEDDKLSGEVLSGVILLALLEQGPALEGAAGALAPEVQEQLEAAGCLKNAEIRFN